MVDKVFENRMRRMAARQGLILQKSGRRDRRARDYGLYRLLVDGVRDLDFHLANQPYTLTIEDVRQRLESGAED